MRELLDHVENGDELSPAQVETAVSYLVDERAEALLKADFLRALCNKGETAGENAAFFRSRLSHSVDPGLDSEALGRPELDVCGTSGERRGDLSPVTTIKFFCSAPASMLA